MISFLGKLTLCLLPVMLSPLWGYLIADGYLNFGGGDKDLFMLVPWIFWSLMYLLIFTGAWIQRKPVKKSLLYAAGGATGILALAWIALFLWHNEILGVYRGK